MGYDAFDKLCKSRGITAYQVAKDTGVTTSTLSSWKTGRYTPKADKLKKIADYFGVSVEYLSAKEDANVQTDGQTIEYYLNPETAKLAQEMFDDPELRSLFHMKRNTDPERFKAYMDMIRKLYKMEHPEDSDDFNGC